MKVWMETLKQNAAELTCYVQLPCEEMPQVQQRPAVLILPGGGYTRCSEREAEPVALAYMQAGYQAFVLKYTTGDRADRESMAGVFPKAYADALEAMAYLRGNAETLHLNPNRIAAVGFSAGGNLAAALGTLAAAEDKPDALVLGYPSVIPEVSARIGLVQPNLLEKVDENTSPAFLFNTQGDTVTPAKNVLLFALAMAEAGVPYEAHTFLTGDHGLSLATAATTDDGSSNSDVAKWHEMSLRFLKNLWDGPDQTSAPRLSVNSKIGTILDDRRACEVLEELLPGVAGRMRKNPASRSMTMATMAKFSGGAISEEALRELDIRLKILN